MTEDSCRPIVVDGETIRVHGARAMNPAEVEAFADIVRAAKRRLAAEDPQPCPECQQKKCRNCDDTTWDEAADGLTICPCSAAGHGTP